MGVTKFVRLGYQRVVEIEPTSSFLSYKRLKLKLRVFLAGHIVAMVTYCVKSCKKHHNPSNWLWRYSDAITRRLKSWNLRLSTKPVAGIVMLFTSEKLKEDYMIEKLSTSKLLHKLVAPPLLLSIRFPPVTTSNGTSLRSWQVVNAIYSVKSRKQC